MFFPVAQTGFMSSAPLSTLASRTAVPMPKRSAKTILQSSGRGKESWARCPPEKPTNANAAKKNSANKTTGNFQVDAGPEVRLVQVSLG